MFGNRDLEQALLEKILNSGIDTEIILNHALAWMDSNDSCNCLNRLIEEYDLK